MDDEPSQRRLDVAPRLISDFLHERDQSKRRVWLARRLADLTAQTRYRLGVRAQRDILSHVNRRRLARLLDRRLAIKFTPFRPDVQIWNTAAHL